MYLNSKLRRIRGFNLKQYQQLQQYNQYNKQINKQLIINKQINVQNLQFHTTQKLTNNLKNYGYQLINKFIQPFILFVPLYKSKQTFATRMKKQFNSPTINKTKHIKYGSKCTYDASLIDKMQQIIVQSIYFDYLVHSLVYQRYKLHKTPIKQLKSYQERKKKYMNIHFQLQKILQY
ncbi:hypothetical protein ABPG72_021489 [Tetrahymena utriculariae]